MLSQKASYHIEHMRLEEIAVTAGLVGFVVGCASTTPAPPVSPPGTPQIPTPAEATTRLHSFAPSLYRYRFEQTADIRAQGSAEDTIPGNVITRATVLVTVRAESDSIFEVTVTIDSISITTQGSILPQRSQEPLRLDSVLSAKFSRTGVVTERRLADSLCMYSQFVTTARELILPELPVQLYSPVSQVYTDTIVDRACRAGTEIELTITRELRDLRREPTELALRQQTRLQGAGVLRRDSLKVSGSITSHGTASFATANRLPSYIQTQSAGMITVQLGNTATVFHQTTVQTIRLDGIEPIAPHP